jgi:hypothetical protein
VTEQNYLKLTLLQKILTVLPPVILILSNIFLFGPFTIYQGNLDEFSFSLISIIQLFIVPSSIIALVLVVVGYLLPEKPHKLYVSMLFILGILIWLQGNILVWKYGLFNGQSIDWTVAQWRGWVDGALWLVLLVSSFIFYKRIYKIVVSGSIALICLQLVLSGYMSITKPEIWKTEFPDSVLAPKWVSDFSPNKNVIHLILDGLQSDVFEEIIRENPEYYSKAFEGFTFFKEATGHFQSTHLSVPAIMSGKVYKNDVPMRDYFKEALTGKNTLNVLRENGYDVDFVPWGEMLVQEHYDHTYLIPSPYVGTMVDYERSKVALMIDLILFRHAPHIIKRAIYNDQKWFIQRTTVSDERMQFRRFGDDAFLHDATSEMTKDREKPVYKFYHLESTHPPFVTSEDCQYAGKVLPFTRKNMETQIRCGLGTVISFLEKLKSTGIYDNSLIIVQADHGYLAPVMLNEGNNLAEGYDIAPWVASAALPLLLIKPPASKGTLSVSRAPVMLMDIPATINSILNLHETFPGKSAFDVQPKEIRKRKFNYFNYSLVNWESDYLPPLDEYTITGSVFERSSWRISLYPTQVMSYSTNKIDLGTKESGQFLGFGWSYREEIPGNENMNATWAEGNSAAIYVALPKTQVKLTANIQSPIKSGEQSVIVMVDGKEVGSWINLKLGKWEKYSVVIEANQNRPSVSIIKFIFSKHTEPNENEYRRLALLFESITISDAPVGQYYSTSKINFGTDDATQFLRTGWDFKEGNPTKGLTYRWALGDSASIYISLPKTKVKLISNVRSPYLKEQQVVTIMVDGEKIESWKISEPNIWERHSVIIEENEKRPSVSIVEFHFSTHWKPDEKENRRLALLFESITLEEQ